MVQIESIGGYSFSPSILDRLNLTGGRGKRKIFLNLDIFILNYLQLKGVTLKIYTYFHLSAFAESSRNILTIIQS